MNEVHMLTGPSATADSPDQGGDLAVVIASRICHDIVGPLGAIANGVELMLLSGMARTPELELIAESVEGANARIRYFRLAYGAPKGRAVGEKEIAAILQGLEKTSRLSYDWAVPGDHPREEIKAVFLLMQCMEAALPMGGRIAVGRDGPAWTVGADGPRLRIHPPIWDAVGPTRAAPPDVAALVQFAVLPGVLDSLSRRLELRLGPERIEARF
jgi:histidine phosphotransferase ChpT